MLILEYFKLKIIVNYVAGVAVHHVQAKQTIHLLIKDYVNTAKLKMKVLM